MLYVIYNNNGRAYQCDGRKKILELRNQYRPTTPFFHFFVSMHIIIFEERYLFSYCDPPVSKKGICSVIVTRPYREGGVLVATEPVRRHVFCGRNFFLIFKITLLTMHGPIAM